MLGHTSKIHFWSVEPVKLMVIILTVHGSVRPIMTTGAETDISRGIRYRNHLSYQN